MVFASAKPVQMTGFRARKRSPRGPATKIQMSAPNVVSCETGGCAGFGDQTGAKLPTVKTYLQDAYDRGAVLVTRCRAERLLVEPRPRGRRRGHLV
jgi:hypothetical protein